MTSLLRLFPQFRLLEHDLTAAESARILAEDSARLWRAKADAAEVDRDRTRAELTNALKSQSNWQALMTGSPHVPFPEVYTPPPPAPVPVNGPAMSNRPISMRDLQRTAILQARTAAAERQQAARANGDG